jgi:hypothetical protein
LPVCVTDRAASDTPAMLVLRMGSSGSPDTTCWTWCRTPNCQVGLEREGREEWCCCISGVDAEAKYEDIRIRGRHRLPVVRTVFVLSSRYLRIVYYHTCIHHISYSYPTMRMYLRCDGSLVVPILQHRYCGTYRYTKHHRPLFHADQPACLMFMTPWDLRTGSLCAGFESFGHKGFTETS